MIANRSIPRSSVIPELAYPDVRGAAAWLCDAFGFSVRILIGNHRAQLNVGDGAMVVTEQSSDAKKKGGMSVMVRVPNVDQHHEHAKQHGALILRSPKDYPYGERQYSAEDFNGYVWTFSQSIADVRPEDWGGEPGEL
jgi:uncharacterized glyoxalase superfamily protein PhnB